MASSAQIASQLAAYDKKRQSSADVLNSAMKQYGVPEIRGRVAGLRTTLANTETALNNVDPSVTGRTSRSLVTEAQRQRMVTNERAPIAQQYGDQSRALTTESANLSDQEKAAQTLAHGRINDFTAGRDALRSQYEIALARETEARRRAEADRAFNYQKESDARNYSLAASKVASSGSSSSSTPNYQQRSKDKGFNFQDAGGNAISARKFAELTGTDFNTLLRKMAAAGDAGAKDVLKNGGSSKAYKALTWN
jgi:uncharacterized small protein (DUF1192 family)